MRSSMALLMASLLTGGFFACSEDDSGGSAAAGCEGFCARTVGCENDPAPDCVRSCRMSASLCPDETAAQHACAAPKPNSDFHCDPDVGVTTLNDGVCSAEGDAVIDCVFDAAF